VENLDFSHLDPALVQNALKVIAALAPLAKEVATDGYHALLDKVKSRFAGNPQAEQALATYEEQPDVGKERLKEELIRLGVAQDQDIVRAAEQVLMLVNVRQEVKSDIDVEFGANAQGNVVGHSAEATNYFGVNPQERKES
jgi:hypothetical protein